MISSIRFAKLIIGTIQNMHRWEHILIPRNLVPWKIRLIFLAIHLST